MYEYNAKIVGVEAGCKVRVDIDLGFGVRITRSVALSGIRCFSDKENRKELMSKLRLQTLLPIGRDVVVISKRRERDEGSAAEYFADILIVEDMVAKSISDVIVEENLANRED